MMELGQLKMVQGRLALVQEREQEPRRNLQ